MGDTGKKGTTKKGPAYAEGETKGQKRREEESIIAWSRTYCKNFVPR
jgi:hypothetical protein